MAPRSGHDVPSAILETLERIDTRMRKDDLGERVATLHTKIDALLTNDVDKEKRLRSAERKIERMGTLNKLAHGISGALFLAILAKLGIHFPTEG